MCGAGRGGKCQNKLLSSTHPNPPEGLQLCRHCTVHTEADALRSPPPTAELSLKQGGRLTDYWTVSWHRRRNENYTTGQKRPWGTGAFKLASLSVSSCVFGRLKDGLERREGRTERNGQEVLTEQECQPGVGGGRGGSKEERVEQRGEALRHWGSEREGEPSSAAKAPGRMVRHNLNQGSDNREDSETSVSPSKHWQHSSCVPSTGSQGAPQPTD